MKRLSFTVIALSLPALLSGGCNQEPSPESGLPMPEGQGRELGNTAFISADGRAGQRAPDQRAEFGDEEVADAGGDDKGDERTVEEGDIYRVLQGNLIANLNAYRGLQIIDFSAVSQPEVIGRLQISGYPVELYVVDNRAFVLMNNWYGYYGTSIAGDVEGWHGGVAISVDISDPTNPVLLSQARVTGQIKKSRLTRQGKSAALYVTAGGWAQWVGDSWESRTVVKSFDVSLGMLKPVSEINLGGYVTDIQATPQALLVARHTWGGGGSEVAIIDINNPNGVMIAGDSVKVAGYVKNQFNMDLDAGILRVVSGSTWGGDNTNHLQTYDAADFGTLTAIDHVTFGDNEDLYATLFLGHKAFFVTYRRIDPFHAFAIDANGYATEMAEFEISGWNDFFRPVLDQTRLVGIGVDDTNGWSMAVSLYDITDLTNPNPLVERIEVGAGSSWSEARWDHRAFSVLDGVVNAVGPQGEAENGLVLLPFSGWSDDHGTYTAGAQIYTFSADSVTKRDVMLHGTPVRRSFLASDNTAGNLSEAELSFFDVTNPDACAELGRVELAPNYTDLLMYGTHAARLKNSLEYYAWWWGNNNELPDATVEMIARPDHPDTAEPVASFLIPADASAYKTGSLLVSVATRYVEGSTYPHYQYDSSIDVHDLSDPTAPALVDSLTTDKLQPSRGYGRYYEADCWDCGHGHGSYGGEVAAVQNALVFLQRHQHSELLGTEQICYTYAGEESECYTGGWQDGCTYYSGNISCRSLNAEPAVCGGEIQRCEYSTSGASSCEPVDPNAIQTREYCYDHQRHRYWHSFGLEVLDLSEPKNANLVSVPLPDREEGVSILADGAGIWVTYRQPIDVPGDSRPYVRYFIKRVDLTNPSVPVIGAPVNVPGELLFNQGNTIFTRDLTWGDSIIETSIARLALKDGPAYLQAIRTFTDQWIAGLALDGAGHILLSHRNSWYAYAGINGVEPDYRQHLSVLDADSQDLTILTDVVVADWASLREAKVGRALFQVPGGMLVFNLDDPQAPYPQAYFPIRGWPREVLLEDNDIIVPAGRYGIYAFDIDAFNMLSFAQ